MTTSRHPSSGRGQSGVALILVVWTFAVLAVLAAEFARAMRDDALSTRNFKQETIAHYVCVAAINEVILALQDRRERGDLEADEAEDQGIVDPVETLNFGDGQWVEGEFNGTKYEVRTTDEGGRLGLNDVSPEVLRLVFRNLEYEQDVGDVITDSIIDWRDEDDAHGINGAEDEYYEGLRRPYQCKDAPFDTIDELLLVRGVTEEIYYGTEEVPGLRDLFSVFNRTKRLNLGSVTPEMMIAIAGLDREEAEELRDRRNENKGELPEELRTLTAESETGTRDGVPVDLTIEARVKDASGRVLSHLGMVGRVAAGGDGLRLYRWYDSIFWEETEESGEADDEAGTG